MGLQALEYGLGALHMMSGDRLRQLEAGDSWQL